MKHAGPETLALLAPLLADIRALPGLAERKPGIFYRRGEAWLHFHEDPAGLFVDVKLPPAKGFKRLAVDTPAQQKALLARLTEQLHA
ncbi:MAG TPA: hypothetical protein VLA61_28020 [Ideonella sp.]|uniref:hypothetical protein n=1 Tax=Ideonella sp. TaxID=1929293 RepID=UPI002D18BED2|nr:hypothetical protein [Ideonella sp.]HSI52132.1 hypothetical protein [Ideonella sp.]